MRRLLIAMTVGLLTLAPASAGAAEWRPHVGDAQAYQGTPRTAKETLRGIARRLLRGLPRDGAVP